MKKNAPKGMFPIPTTEYKYAYREQNRLGCEKVTNIRAIATGEYRIPKKGEWYLSGAIIEAYFAPEDFVVTPYYIAKLVRTRLIKTRIIV